MIGAFFIMAAWVYEAYETYKKGQKLDVKFIGFYIIGLSFLLIIHIRLTARHS